MFVCLDASILVALQDLHLFLPQLRSSVYSLYCTCSSQLDVARQALSAAENKNKDMTQRMTEQHSQIMWLDESLQKEKKRLMERQASIKSVLIDR